MTVTRLKKPLRRRLDLGGHDVVVTLTPQGIVVCRRYRARHSACLSLENLLNRFLRDPRGPLEQIEMPMLERPRSSLELVGRSR